MNRKVKLLNEKGVKAFLDIHGKIVKDYFPKKIGSKGAPISLVQINQVEEISSNSSYVDELRGFDLNVDDDLIFSSKLELGKYLFEILEKLPSELKVRDELWSWLALVYFRQLLKLSSGKYELHSSYRYIFQKSNGLRYMRHSVYFSYFTYAHLGDDSAVFLWQKPNTSGDFTNWATRQDILTNREFAKMCHDYFFNSETKKYAKDFTSKNKRWNMMNMFTITLAQLKMNYDPHACDASRLFGLLPEEYKRRSFNYQPR